MKGRSTAGVTLIEMLIAVSLFSLLSTGVLMALRVGLKAMEKANGRLMENRRMAGAQRILEEQIAGLIPVIAQSQSGRETANARRLFFQGEPQAMRLVSAYSLGEAWRGYPRVLEFQVTPGSRGEGVRLVVNEHLYTGPRGAGVFYLGTFLDPALGVQVPRFRPIEIGPQSFVLADRLAFCRFFYREIVPPPVRERWVTRWIVPVWPAAIRIEMAPLASDASRIQPLTITAPVHINREPTATYTD